MELKASYQKIEGDIPQDWRECDISDICLFQRGFDITEVTRKPGVVPVYSSSGLSYYHSEAKLFPPTVVTGRKGILGKVFYIEEPCWPHDTTLWIKDFKKNDPKFTYWFLVQFKLERFDAATSVPTLNRNNIVGVPIVLPPPSEQRVIAAALDDVDALINAQDKLLVKKRDIKQATMQQLLTGKKRLPGFSDDWEPKTLEKLAVVSKGSQLPRTKMSLGGEFAHLNGGITPSCYTSQANTPANTIAISEGGNSCGYVQFMTEPYWCGGHCYSLTPIGVDNDFLYHALKAQQLSIMALRVGSGLPNVQKTRLLAFTIQIPNCRNEQIEIASVLSDMDKEIRVLEEQRDKMRALKQGMMQELLTGRIRLV